MDRDDELPISVRLAMCPAERERDPSGCRASGRHITLELPVHVVLILQLPVPPLLRLQALVPGVHVNRIAIAISWIAIGSIVLRPLWWLQKQLWILFVPATALSSRRLFPRVFAAPEAYRRGGKSGGYIAMKLNNTHFNSSRHNRQL